MTDVRDLSTGWRAIQGPVCEVTRFSNQAGERDLTEPTAAGCFATVQVGMVGILWNLRIVTPEPIFSSSDFPKQTAVIL